MVTIRDYLDRFPTWRDRLEPHLRSLRDPHRHPSGQPLPVPRLPSEFGRYRIQRDLGAGNMGRVYLAHDPILARDVALKVPLHYPTETMQGRLFQEARTAGQLHHSHICPVYDAGIIDEIPYLTMRYIDGQTLNRAYPPPLPAAQAVELTLVLAETLQYAHSYGIIHRDLKPTNVMVERDTQTLLITDFGLGRQLAPSDARLTVEERGFGSPAYMAPEQARDASTVGPCADVYALGVILFELLTQHLPYSGSADAVIWQKVRNEPPARPQQFVTHLDIRLEAIVLNAIANDTTARYATMEELAQALRAWLDTQSQSPAANAAVAASPPTTNDPRFVSDALDILRKWGWDEGLRRLRAQAEQADPQRQAALRLMHGWLDAEQGRYAKAEANFQSAATVPQLRGWVFLGQALIAGRERNDQRASELFNQAEPFALEDCSLRASIAHSRGALALHQGHLDEALNQLHTALELFGSSHFCTGRVLDTLGMLHHHRGRLGLAHDYFDRALSAKRANHDELGIAVTLDQLGRLQLDYENFDRAEEHFLEALSIARRTNDERGECIVCNNRAQVRIARGQPDKL